MSSSREKRVIRPSGTRETRARAKLEIDLYLKKIDQERIMHTPTYTRTAKCERFCYYAVWPKSCCIGDFFITRRKQPLAGLLYRQEDVGGMMWNPRTKAVYKLGEDAYHAILDLESGFSELEIARRNNLSLSSVRTLVGKLKRIAK